MLTRDGHGKRKKIRIRYDFFYGMNIIQLNIYTIVLFEILTKSMMCVSGFFSVFFSLHMCYCLIYTFFCLEFFKLFSVVFVVIVLLWHSLIIIIICLYAHI